jgi:type I restriction enzyme S subunit
VNYIKYLDYKDSGLEWIGKIPAHWEIRKLRFICDLIQTGKTPPTSEKKYYENTNIRWFSPSDFTEQLVLQQPTRFISSLAVKDKMAPIFEKGSLMIIGIGATTGKVGLLEESSSCNQQITGLVFKSNILPKFAGYFFKTQEESLNSIAPSATLPILNNELIANLSLAFPPKTEQQKLVNYIEIEIKRLDTLIAAKERLLVLLAEKRRALITQAVTRGLKADVPMRDSGIDWLGEVPRHWKVVRLKFLCISLQTGPFGSQLHADEYIENGVPVINPVHLSNGKILPDLSISIDIETVNRLSIHKLLPEDVVFARRGELGRCGVVTNTEKGWICGTGSLRARLKNKFLISIYLFLYVTNTGASDSLSLESVGSTMDNLNTETLGELPILCPPIEEQKIIIKYIEAETKKLDLLKAVTERTISLLKERRASLIAAAVTGQIAVGEQV